MKLVFLADVTFYDCAITFVKICQDLQQFLVRLVYSPDQIRELIFLKVFTKSSQAMVHKFVDLNGIMVLVLPMNGKIN